VTDQPHAPSPLRLWPLLGDSARALVANHRIFIALALIPVLSETVIETLSIWIYKDDPPPYFFAISCVVTLGPWIVFTVGMYRVVLVGPHVIGTPVHLRWGRREWLSAWYSFVLFVLAMAPLAAVFLSIDLVGDSSEPTPDELDDSNMSTASINLILGVFSFIAAFLWPRFFSYFQQ
jgi:hypothetical protein